MTDQIRLFLMQLHEQLGSLRAIVVRECRMDDEGLVGTRAALATRLLGSSSELLGMVPLTTWLRGLLGWLEERGDLEAGLSADEARLLREVVAFEERLVDRLVAVEDVATLVSSDDLAIWQRRFRAKSDSEMEVSAPPPASIRLAGLEDLRATLSADALLDIVDRLVTKVPADGDGAAVADGERARLGERWRRTRRLCEALFRTLGADAAAAGQPTTDVAGEPTVREETIPLGLQTLHAALRDGFREGLVAVRAGTIEHATTPRMAWLTAEARHFDAGAGTGLRDEELLPISRQAAHGRALGLIAADLTVITGGGAPWAIEATLSPDHLLIDYQRPPGRLRTEAHRVLSHLWSDEYLLELPNLRAALRKLGDEGVLVIGSFGAGHKGRLRLSLPVRPGDGLVVLVLSLGKGRAALPIHLVEEVVPLDGWRRWVDDEGERLGRDGTELALVDAASWVEGLLPIDPDDPTSRVVVSGNLDKRVAVLVAGPPERVVARVASQTSLDGWEAVATRGVRLPDGATLPLLDLERVISLRLCGVAAVGLGGSDALPVC